MNPRDPKNPNSPGPQSLAEATQLRARGMVPWILLATLAVGVATLFVLHFQYEIIVATSLMWGAALYVTGALLGFLFGIPKIAELQVAPATQANGTAGVDSGGQVQEVPKGVPAVARRSSGINSNLVEVSDWLTKIIVGVGLVELKNLPEYGRSLANFMGESLGKAPRVPPSTHLTSVAGAISLFFGVLGFITGYLLTRIYLSIIMNDADRSAEQISDLRLSGGEVVSTPTMLGNLQSSVEDLQRAVAQGMGGASAPVAPFAAAAALGQDFAAIPAAASPDVTAPVRSVLWVDDKPRNNTLIVDQLQRAGVQVQRALSTDEGLAALRRGSFGVVITDMQRPESSTDGQPAGIRFLRQLADLAPAGGDDAVRPVAIVYCGKGSAARYGDQATRAGATAVTSSPVELISILTRVIPGFGG
jgi:CheY-like chemotaxis protein